MSEPGRLGGNGVPVRASKGPVSEGCLSFLRRQIGPVIDLLTEVHDVCQRRVSGGRERSGPVPLPSQKGRWVPRESSSPLCSFGLKVC